MRADLKNDRLQLAADVHGVLACDAEAAARGRWRRAAGSCWLLRRGARGRPADDGAAPPARRDCAPATSSAERRSLQGAAVLYRLERSRPTATAWCSRHRYRGHDARHHAHQGRRPRPPGRIWATATGCSPATCRCIMPQGSCSADRGHGAVRQQAHRLDDAREGAPAQFERSVVAAPASASAGTRRHRRTPTAPTAMRARSTTTWNTSCCS